MMRWWWLPIPSSGMKDAHWESRTAKKRRPRCSGVSGAYGAQGKGALFVRRIDGDFFNVMGLPLCLLGQMLAGKGVQIL